RAEIAEILRFLSDEQVLFFSEGSYHWMDDAFPAEDISLRSATRENVVIIDTTGSRPQAIGEVDRFSAPMLVHEEAIYMHGGRQYQVEKLDFEEKKAYVRQVKANYFTDAQLEADLKVLDVLELKEETTLKAWGEVRINAVVPMFKKIRFNTHENLGSGKISLPETEMHTTAFWIGFPPESCGGMGPQATQSGLRGLSNLLPQIAALFLMGDTQDLKAICQVKSPFTGYPTIFLYDSFPGGVGYSQELYGIYRQIMQAARQVIINCCCREGCPSCVGPDILNEGSVKQYCLGLIEVALNER
ncbi:MAG TPA: DEAD/DEAH box helicase, partial [Firmicutes bacterium]|nr:DEAD/DEAH box helicase [Bacillota bacterium]